jgi:hypothetical protein
MTDIFGSYIERDYLDNRSDDTDSEFLIINFLPTSTSLQQRWRNNGLSADFLADYVSTFFPGEDAESLNRRSEIKGGVSYIANELLENAMKFNYSPAKHSVSIGMNLKMDEVIFYVSNSINPAIIKPFQELIQRLLTEDPNELYMEKLMENNEEDEDNTSSGLGYLTMINDWNAKLAWKFEDIKNASKLQKVTVMVQIPFE